MAGIGEDAKKIRKWKLKSKEFSLSVPTKQVKNTRIHENKRRREM